MIGDRLFDTLKMCQILRKRQKINVFSKFMVDSKKDL